MVSLQLQRATCAIALYFLTIAIEAQSTEDIFTVGTQLKGETSTLSFSTNDWLPGHATHYGPYPGYPGMSENGYQFNDVGVGCSNGEPGGDPRWNSIKDHGLIQNPLDSKTVWPIVPTVAVSEFSWGGSNKDKICYQTLNIRNAHNHSQRLTAYVVDFCPTKGCMWSAKERQFNVDIYGQRTFSRLGGALMDGIIDIEIQWPTGIIANSAKNDFSFKTILIVLVSSSLLVFIP